MEKNDLQPVAESHTPDSSPEALFPGHRQTNEEVFIRELLNNNRRRIQFFPDKQTAENFIEQLFEFMFVGQICKHYEAVSLSNTYQQLKNTFAALLFEVVPEEEKAKADTALFFDALPFIYQTLLKDAEAILQSDPAARSLEEVLAAYPGFYATVIYRLSHQLWKQGVSILPRLFSEYAHSKTGIDIHPGAEIGEAFAIDHGTGVVVGETTVIGNHVKLYQGVTLGALNVSKENASTKRHPTIEDNVVIYSGATILGGKTVIGTGCVIGGNVWLTYSVPPNSVVYHKSEIRVKDKDPFPEPLNFVI
ncbi:serine O-acetyltransferase EpsC [Paraflavisolibacter sp. H34]|uniref:serine O-acetyltransferase EpsC n=1 Tax=Huijunlia imazamoxiresistens TaxID=3127457 RepID=UPI00301633FD